MDKIATLLQGTLSSTKQIRLESENELEILGAQNGFMEQLLLINSKTSLIYLKNLLKRYPSRRNNDFKAILFVLLQKKHQTGSAENFDLIIDCFILMAEQEDILTCLQENMLRVVESYCRMNAYNDDIKIIAENLQLVRPKMSNRDEIKSMLKIFYFCSRQRIDVNLYIAVVIPFMSIEDLNIKKWVMKVLNRYSNSNSLNAGQLFQHYVTLFDIDNVKIKELILSFVIRHSTTLLPFMNQYKDEIFYKLIMPLMRFNDKGIEEWLDQREFIVNYIGRNFRICFDALETLCKNKEMYDCTLNYLATHQVVDDYDLFGYISCALPIADRFLQSEPLAEQFLIARIFPCLDSTSQGYNRAMAFFCCSKYSRIHYMDKKNLELLFLKVIGALGDKYTAVKMCALLVIPQFIKYPEVTLETGLDTVSNVLEILVLEYGAQLKPYAIQLCSQLVNQLAVLIQHDGDEDIDEMEDKSMAAIGVLNALSALVKSLESNYAILSSLETIILPALQYIFTHACMDLMEESFDLVLEILHCSKSVSVTMWNLFPCLHQNLKVYALDYFEQAYPILQYFASHGESGLAQNDQVKSQLLELALLILKDHDCRDEEKACSCVLIETIMQRAKGTIDQLLILTLESVIPLFQDNEEISGPVRVHLLKTILNCIYCNASVAAKYFEQIDFLNQFIELLSTNSCNFKIIHDQKLAINSISRLCSLVRTDGFVLGNRLIKLIEIALVIFEKLLELEEQIRKGSISSAAISVDKDSLDSNWDDGNLEDVPCPASPSDDENIYQLFASVINPLLQNNQVELNLLNSSQVSVLKLVLHYQ